MSKLVLIVDDHEMIREGLKYAFDHTDLDVLEAENGETALRLLREFTVDIVLLDIDLPGLDGLEVLRRIKQEAPQLPVLMHSSHESVVNVARSIALGASGYIIKTPDATSVIDAIGIGLAGGTIWTPAQLRLATSWTDSL